MFQAKFEEAKYLTLGVGVVNVTFTLVAVSRKPPIFSLQCCKTQMLILSISSSQAFQSAYQLKTY